MLQIEDAISVLFSWDTLYLNISCHFQNRRQCFKRGTKERVRHERECIQGNNQTKRINDGRNDNTRVRAIRKF